MGFESDDIIQVFIVESEENLRTIEEGLMALETSPADDATLQDVFRAAHTLKGNASFLGLSHLGEMGHAVEDLLDGFRKGSLQVTGQLITLLLEAVDALRQILANLSSGNQTLDLAQSTLVARLRERRSATAPSVVRALDGDPVEALVSEDAFSSTEEETAVDRDDGAADIGAISVPLALPTDRETPRAVPGRSKTLRVDIERLDRMLNLTGEITIARGRLAEMLAHAGDYSPADLLEAHDDADRLYLELQEQVMKVRMVRVGPLFRQFSRTVRDVAAAVGKQVRLEIEGEDVEVDTAVIENIRDPLAHMIRNAIDHGIEPPDLRAAAGKDPCGRISLRAFHSEGSIVIQLADDGAGFDRERIANRAREIGYQIDAEKSCEQDVLRLVFEPGFSTAESVTDLSGRGVGMDVVRRNIETLRGAVSVDSREGAGATITIRLPLTLAIIEGFSVGVGFDTYVVPLESVVECLELPAELAGSDSGTGIINLRGEPLPFLRLRDRFGVGGEPPPRESVVVVQHAAGRAGIAVDSLFGSRQTVIKPLGRLFRSLPGISGSAILGNGRVALILDVPTILRDVIAPEALADRA